jgi:hypothetical protein
MTIAWVDWHRCGFCDRLCRADMFGTTLAHPRNGVVYRICTECFGDRLTVTRDRPPRPLFSRLSNVIDFLREVRP